MQESGEVGINQLQIKYRGICHFLITTLFCFAGIFSSMQLNGYPSAIQLDIEQQLKGKSGKERIDLLIRFANQVMPDDPAYGLMLSKEAETLARQKSIPLLLSDALKLKADALFYLDSLPASLAAYIESAEADRQSGNTRADSVMRRTGDAGHVYYRMGLFDKAIEYHNRALAMGRTLKDTAEIATNLFNLALAYNMTGRYDKAVEHMLDAIALDKITGNTDHLSTNYNALGMVYLSWGNTGKAMEFITLALDHDIQAGDEAKMAIRLSNKSKVYMAENRFGEARQALEQALEIDRRLNNTMRVAIRLQGLGLIYNELGDYEQALVFLIQALEIFKSYELNYKIAGLKIQIGKLYQNTGDIMQAEAAYLEGLALSAELNLRPEEMEAVNHLYRLYKEQEKFALAMQFLEKHKTLQDSLFSEKSAQLIHDFEVKYETEKKEQENQLLIKENTIRRRTQRLFAVAIVGLVLISASLLWAFTLKRKSLLQSRILFEKESELSRLKIVAVEKQNSHLQELLFAEEEIKRLQQKSIEQKSHELTSAAMLIAGKNEVFEKLKKLAEKIKPKQKEEDAELVKEIITEIDRQTDMESQWDQFKQRFESVHKSFFDKLRKKNGQLTQNDLQLCTYVKMNLTTKEIARLMNIAPDSVNTHRYRLRKKIKLAENETLDEFIHKL